MAPVALTRSLQLVLALLLTLFVVGPRCGGFKSIAIDTPADGLIVDAEPVAVSARLADIFDPLSAEVRLDGVDLIAALGLTPPFSGAGGVVDLGGDLVTVSNFTFTAADLETRMISLELLDLDPGEHLLEVEAERVALEVVTMSAAFTSVAFFTPELDVLAAAGLPEGPEPTGPGGSVLANATLGDPLATAPVALSGGGELRAGFVEATEGRIAGAGP